MTAAASIPPPTAQEIAAAFRANCHAMARQHVEDGDGWPGARQRSAADALAAEVAVLLLKKTAPAASDLLDAILECERDLSASVYRRTDPDDSAEALTDTAANYAQAVTEIITHHNGD